MKHFKIKIMKINIIGQEGSFGGFLKKELPKYGFEILPLSFPLPAESRVAILAVPFSSYNELARTICFAEWHKRDLLFVNVCSVQKPSTDILLKYTDKVLSIHPLFGVRTPSDKRNSIWTHGEDNEFLVKWRNFSVTKDMRGIHGNGPENHDKLMARTHLQAVLAAKQFQHIIKDTQDIPDELIPQSFRLLRNFVQTLEDTPVGTISSILSNPYQ